MQGGWQRDDVEKRPNPRLDVVGQFGPYPADSFFTSKNLGMGVANNIGIKKAKTDFVLILNPDVILEKTTIINKPKFNNWKNELVGAKLIDVKLNSELRVIK